MIDMDQLLIDKTNLQCEFNETPVQAVWIH